MEKYLLEHELKPSDAIHLATMEKAGIKRIASEDQEFDKVRGIERIWVRKDLGQIIRIRGFY